MFMISYPHPSIPKISIDINKLWLCVYDARDDWDEFEKSRASKWYILSMKNT